MTITQIIIPSLKNAFLAKWHWLLALLVLTPLTIQNEWKQLAIVSQALDDPDGYFWFVIGLKEGTFGFSELLVAAANNFLGVISLIIVGILLITAFFFILWVVVTAQGIIISSHKEAKKLTLSQSLKKVEALWLPMLELNISLILVRILSVSLLLVLMTLLSNDALSPVRTTIFFGLMILFMLFSFVIRIALFKVVLERKDVRLALQEAYTLIKRKKLESFELSLILFIMTIIGLRLMGLIIDLFLSVELQSATFIHIISFQDGIIPFVVGMLVTLFILATVGYLSLVQYTAWLTWYTEVTNKHFENSYSHRFLKRILSYVKRTTIN